MNILSSFENHFLVAMPQLQEPLFSRAVIYLYEHDEEGATGIVINKPMRITLADVFKHLNIAVTAENMGKKPVLLGGPVAQEQGFILVRPAEFNSPDTPIIENEHIVISTSKKVLQDIAAGSGPESAIVVLGYAAWSVGQLEEEIASNSWLVAPANKEILFDLPFAQRWTAAVTSIGVDPNRLSHESGHA